MPAAPSSPIEPSIGHLVALTETYAEDRAGLLSVLAKVPDPRKPRGVRHRLASATMTTSQPATTAAADALPRSAANSALPARAITP